MTVSFDTLAYAKKLKEAGFTEQQAEAQVQALAGIVEERLATKTDIELLRQDTRKEIEVLRQDTRKEIEVLRQDTRKEIDLIRRDMNEMELRLKYDLTVRMGAMITAAVAVLAAMKFF